MSRGSRPDTISTPCSVPAPWFVTFNPRTSSAGRAGKFTLRHASLSQPAATSRRMTSGACASAVFHGTALRSVNAWLSAMAGTPTSMLVIAAPTVPENTVSVPRFAPRFTPDSTTSGRASFIRWLTAIATQSPGVPRTAKRRSPLRCTRSGSCRLSECDVPLWSSAGATIHTSRASCVATCSSTSRPGASNPSSLVSRTRSNSGRVSCIGAILVEMGRDRRKAS